MANSFLDDLNARMQEAQSSPEYQSGCQRFREECLRLEAIAKELLPSVALLEENCLRDTVRKEYAAGSDLHRGYYCPSPTYDLVVGNTKRGKLLKKPAVLSKPSHEYGYDAQGRMLYCKWLDSDRVSMTEYLIHQGNTVYGILVDRDGDISTITEEVYSDGKLTGYLQGLCIPCGSSFQCGEINCEYYEYDAEGLFRCEMHSLKLPMQDPPAFLNGVLPDFMQQPIYSREAYDFQRENGYLTGYLCEGHKVRIRTRRKA